MKGGRAAAKAAATVLEGGQKLSNRYKGTTKANLSNYVLISVGGKVREDKNRGEGGRADGGGGGGRDVSYQRNNLKRFFMHGKMNASGAELEAEEAESNRGRVLGHPPQEGWVGQVEAFVEAVGYRDVRQG